MPREAPFTMAFRCKAGVFHALFLFLGVDHLFKLAVVLRCAEILYYTDAVCDVVFRNVVVLQIDIVPSVFS